METQASSLENRIQDLARALYRSAAKHKPSIFEPRDWLGKMVEWSLRDEALRVALFRFVDVLPSLRTAGEIGRHLEDYFSRVDHAFGGLVMLAQALHAGWMFAPVVRQNLERLARRFIAEEDRESLRRVIEMLRGEPAAFTLDVVGEATVSDREALAIQCRYLDLLQNLASMARSWREIPQIDRGPAGPLPRVHLSLKLSALCPRFDPLDPDSEAVVRERLRPLFREAARLGAALTIDMEQHAFKDLTVRIFCGVLEEEEFAAEPPAAIAVQAYLRDSERDLRDLLSWAAARKRRIGVRLVKGAYWDSEIAWARQKGWPIPVFLEKSETDANYERLTRLLLENSDVADAAFGTHNIRSIAQAIVTAGELGVAPAGYEFQMLYGMGEPIRRAVIQNGQRVRVYLPTGRLLPGMAYLIRRLMENTSNTSFLRQAYVEEAAVEQLILPPQPRRPSQRSPRQRTGEGLDAPFRNEPVLDFSVRENRERFAEELRQIRRKFGRSYPLVVGGEEIETGRWLESVNPAAPREIVGRAAAAGRHEIERAVEAASAFFPKWRATPARQRAELLTRAAAIMRKRRFELAAWELFEVGKGWREADADVVEAIDYLEYYARESLRLAQPRRTQEIPGELDLYFYEPRGVAAVIAPWNFPLAILTGMTAAALATGNCVVVKPAEQSPVTGALMLEILREAGVPDGACHLLQGGGDVGGALVRHTAIHVIAFTGSLAVGLEILRAAYDHQPGQEHIKRVVCEMGGKNAIIVDSDADLDEAIQHTVESAFGYQGQKCSAASRLVLLDEIHDLVLGRLTEAVKSLKIGPPEDPRNFLGPVIDAEARERILDYIELGKREGSCVLERAAPAEGYFVGPAIFSDVECHHRLANEEIFGPVLAVLRARDFDHALEIATRSSYALTGGLFSRAPRHIEKARQAFRVGNLYINRGITGAVVERHPFGGLKLSGIGSKAGGPDYLLQFVEPRTVSENTLRHGFVPPEELRRQ
ncbi:MAG TPA: L-glutamate gamma-semialdehyde dehydrogenase [candidate division Zixibacteria bacterium]|nr:L-glutamate gamma-semialdehyde dehydrogenase [candidate division Zixibacteria bacterium]